jgi:hypothetical protein
MAPRRLRALLIGALLLCCGCQHLGRSGFAPCESPPPADPVPENCYWKVPARDRGIEEVGPGSPAAADRPHDPAFNLLESSAPGDVRFASDETRPDDAGPWLYGSPQGAPAPIVAPDDSDTLLPEEPYTWRRHLREDCHALWPEIKQDYKNYYSWHNGLLLASGFGVGAALANSNADQDIRNWYQDHVRSSGSDDFAHIAKKFGNGGYVVGMMGAGWLTGEMFYDTTAGDALSQWGLRGLRSAIVGTPPMLFMQYVTGGSRPGETDHNSQWRPFSDNNGVSGHSFACGLLFINAAKMTDEWPLKLGFYGLSTMAGWSRINDDAHYTSQVILGWWMAYCACTAVDNTNQDRKWMITPLPMPGAAGLAVTYQY